MFWLVIALAYLLLGYASTIALIRESVDEEEDLKWNRYVIIASAIVIVGWPFFWIAVIYLFMNKTDTST